MHEKFEDGKLSFDFIVKDGILYFKKKYYISLASSLKIDIIKENHDSLVVDMWEANAHWCEFHHYFIGPVCEPM